MDSARFTLFVKQDCQTCTLLVPVFERLRESLPELAIYVQDDPAFLSSAGAAYDKTLENSFRADIEITPTLIRMAGTKRDRPRLRVGSRRMAEYHRDSRFRLRSACLQPRLRIENASAWSVGATWWRSSAMRT